MAKRLSRTTVLQYQELLEFVRRNKVVLTGKTTLVDQKGVANLWQEFATSINSKGLGPEKNAEQWRRVTEITKRIFNDHALASSYLSVIAERFAHPKKWKPRQTFALLCIELMKQEAMLPHLLDLSWDPVANVRLVVASCIVKHILQTDY